MEAAVRARERIKERRCMIAVANALHMNSLKSPFMGFPFPSADMLRRSLR